MAEPLRVGAIGATIQLNITDQDGAALDISTATLTSNLYIRRPSNSVVSVTPSFVSSGTDGQIYYDTISGTLTEPGSYTVQFKLVMGGDTIPCNPVTIPVEPNIYP